MRSSPLIRAGAVALVAGLFVASGPPARAMSIDPILGSIGIFAGNFAPAGWAKCDGQILQIQQNTALFSILGTTYGGDGKTTFALPDLRGRVPVHAGKGNGLSDCRLGQAGGAESHALTVAELPSHSHALNTLDAAGTADKPAGGVLASNAGAKQYAAVTPDVKMQAAAAAAIGATGTGTAFEVRPPYLGLTFCIATQGNYPSRE